MAFGLVKFALVGAVFVMTSSDAFATMRKSVGLEHDQKASELIEAHDAIYSGRVSVLKIVVGERGRRRFTPRRVTRLKVKVEATLKGKARRSLGASECDYRPTSGDHTRTTMTSAGLERGTHVVVFFTPGGTCSLAKIGSPGVTTLDGFRWSWNRERGHFDELMEVLEVRHCGDPPGEPGARPGREPEFLGYGTLTRLGEDGLMYRMNVVKAPAHEQTSGVRCTRYPSQLIVQLDKDYGLGERAAGRISGIARDP